MEQSQVPHESPYGELIDELRDRFPDLMPITRLPPIGLNYRATGVMVVGHYDADDETDTYVTTLAITIYGIPVFTLGAYRVLDAFVGDGHFISLNLQEPQNRRAAIAQCCQRKGDWHFIGREKLPNLSRALNAIVIFLLVVVAIETVRSW